MDNWFQSKWFVRGISLILAISLYLIATIEPNTTKDDSSILPGIAKEVQVLEDIPLEVKIDSEEHVVSGVPEYVTVTLEGKSSVLAPVIRQKGFTTFVDLTGLDSGDHVVPIEYENIPDDIAVYIEPKSIEVTIEKRASKEFAVEVDFVNMDKLPSDYELGEVKIDPELVTVVSSESVIERIAMVKVYIDVTDLKESIRNREVPISVSDINGNSLNVRVEPGSAVVSVDVERPSKKVPLTLPTKGELPDGFSLEKVEGPEEIDIYGKRAILSEIEELSTEEIDLAAINESGEIEVGLALPEGVTVNESEVKVTLTLEETKEFEDLDIKVVGDSEGEMSFVEPESGKVTITARAHDKVMAELKEEDIKLSINIAGLKAGEHQVELTLKGPDGVMLESPFEDIKVEIDSED